MDKEPWVFKDNKKSGLDAFNKALIDTLPQRKEEWDKLMNEDISDTWGKLNK